LTATFSDLGDTSYFHSKTLGYYAAI